MSTSSITKDPKHHTERDILTQTKEAVVRNWFIIFVALLLVWVGLPWLAPVFMELGWEQAANVIYTLYSYQCHQLPQRSFFLFGPQTMYSLDQIQVTGVEIDNLLELRRFIGNPELGYKVAWSDRMVSAYGSIPLATLVWWPLRRRLRGLSIWGFVILALPMGIDAGTHFLSDLAGLGEGFRYTNEWLAQLTGRTFPTTFYVGNALGSFNSWMRLITGTLFGAGVVWLSFPLFWETALQSKKSRVNRQQAMGLDHD
jgi:uncharacterized membrane protein